jgi:outer membrane lipoprotein-sorting protein
MKKCIQLAFVCAVIAMQSVGAQTLPSANEVFDKYYQAIGGKEFLNTIVDATVDMNTNMQGNPAVMTKKVKSPNKFVSIMNSGGMEVFKMTSDGTKVVMNSMQGEMAMNTAESEQAILQGMLIPELQYSTANVTSVVNGIEKINGADAYKVTNKLASGGSWTDFYDVTSGLKVRTIMSRQGPDGEMQQIITLSDYKDFKGLKYPGKIVQDLGMFVMELSVDKVKINTGLKDETFKIK